MLAVARPHFIVRQLLAHSTALLQQPARAFLPKPVKGDPARSLSGTAQACLTVQPKLARDSQPRTLRRTRRSGDACWHSAACARAEANPRSALREVCRTLQSVASPPLAPSAQAWPGLLP